MIGRDTRCGRLREVSFGGTKVMIPKKTCRVVLLAYDEMNLLDLSGPLQALVTANRSFSGRGPALYETIARTKAWRGESTARALFSLGEIQRLRKAYPEAIAYYQRCFVSWARYPQWCARAYHRAADSFEALGRRPEAISHLREMLRKSDKYGRLPEFNEAKTRLRAWGEVVQ